MIKKLCGIVVKISIILSVVLFIFKPLRNIYFIIGLLIGSYYTIVKTYNFENNFKDTLSKPNISKKNIMFKSLFSQILNFIVLILAVIINKHLFIGTAVGLLILPFVITITSIKNKGSF